MPVSLRLALLPALALALFAGATWAALPPADTLPQPTPATTSAWSPLAPRYREVQHVVVEGDTASKVLGRLLADGNARETSAATLLGAARGRFDSLSLKDVLTLEFRDGEAEPWRVRLDKRRADYLELVRSGASWALHERPVPYTVTTGPRHLVVESSLWEAGIDAGLEPSQILSIAQIFEYDVDFNTELVKGARLSLAADTLTDEAGAVRVGSIRGARLENGGKAYTSIRYVHKDGSVAWYGPDGLGQKRPFLRSPLEFSRVTSSFSTGRFHPILKVRRPHLGVDFGAPTGTPVRAVADGVVTSSGRNGGHGNYVELDHEGPYATSYSHLSSVLVRRGQKVTQGQLIGRVGATGLATGPHLHYQFFVNGRYQDPMQVKLPTTAALAVEEKEAFFKVRDEVLPLLQPAGSDKPAPG